MILLEKRAHLILKTPSAVVCLLPIDIVDEGANIRRTDGEQPITALPREVTHPLLFHPRRRPRLNLRYEFCSRSCRCQPHCKMNVVGNAAHPKAFAIQFACRSREIGIKRSAHILVDQRGPMFRAENHMYQVKALRLRHGKDYMPGLQPFLASINVYLGLRPRLVCRQTYGPYRLSLQLRQDTGRSQSKSRHSMGWINRSQREVNL
jgi:hypothetical protein